MAVPIDTVAVVDQLQQFFLQESNDSGMAYGLSIAGHTIIALLLMFGVFERIGLIPVAAIPVEIVMERPAAVARQDAPASPPAAFALNEQNHPSGIPAVADVGKRANAPLAALNVNGIDRPKQPGRDGRDPSSDLAGIPLPPADTGLASGSISTPSREAVIRPIGPAPPQKTALEPGEDELTALKEQKVECGIKAKRPSPAATARRQARVRGFVTEAQMLAVLRLSQAAADRHINPNFIRYHRVFVETLDGARKFVVLLPSGLTVNVGDVIEYDRGYIDPSDSCQYIPNLAISKP
jgi:hypothetical protein